MQKAWIAPVLQKRQRQSEPVITCPPGPPMTERWYWMTGELGKDGREPLSLLARALLEPFIAGRGVPASQSSIELASQVVVLSRVSISKQACLNAREHAVSTPSPVKRDINCASILDRLGCGGSYPYARLTHGLPLATSKCWSCKFAHRWPASIPPVGPA